MISSSGAGNRGMNLRVLHAGVSVVNGMYQAQPFSSIPAGFAKTCTAMNWDSKSMWNQLAIPQADWYLHKHNDSYIYLHQDGRWWLDDPTGAGIYVCKAEATPSSTGRDDYQLQVPSKGWEPLAKNVDPMPVVEYLPEDVP